MVKIISLFKRNYNTDRLVYNEVVEGAEWVISGEGIATQKFDGTCCMVRDGKLYKRYDAKKGRAPSIDFEPAQEPDEVTGHWPGWVPIVSYDKWHVEAALNSYADELENGTYELIGPKIQGNPEKASRHILVRHGSVILRECPRDYEGIKQYLSMRDIEGIVWHHCDGRMVKIKRKDFGMKRGEIYMNNKVDYEELMELLTKALTGPTTVRWGITFTHHTVTRIKEQLQYWHDYAVELRGKQG